MLFFLDESGHDHHEAPYEVLAAVAIAEADLWNLIQAIRAAEIEYFGVHLKEVGLEFKGKKLLKQKTFRHARQGAPLDPLVRRDLAREFLQKGWREAHGGEPEPRSREEFTAYGQAVCGFVERVFILCHHHRVKTFAALVETDAPQGADANWLRKDYAFLFERFYHYLENRPPSEMGMIVFDELEKTQSSHLIQKMERYFLEAKKGYQFSSRILPEPFFVHSDLTTAIQLADIVAYCFNWGTRLKKMVKPTRSEIEPFAKMACDMRYSGITLDEATGKEWQEWGIFHISDLRPRKERHPEKSQKKGNDAVRSEPHLIKASGSNKTA